MKAIAGKAVEGRVVNRGDEDDGIPDLDAWLEEEEAEEEVKPYSFTFREVLWTLASPQDFDWQEYSRAQENPETQDARPLVHLLMGDEQYEKFCGLKKVPTRLIGKVIEDWQAHHGVTVPESRASRRSTQRTAGPSKRTSSRRTR